MRDDRWSAWLNRLPLQPAHFDHVLAGARAAGIDDGQIEIARPAEPGEAWTVTEIKRSWPTEVDAAAVDAATGEVVDVVSFDDDYGLIAKLARWGIDAHMGCSSGGPTSSCSWCSGSR